MQIGPIEVFAQPPGYITLGTVRDATESAINTHNRNRRRCRVTGKLLESIRDELNQTIRVEASDIAPLTRRVFA